MTSTFESYSKIGQIFSENIDDLVFIVNDHHQCEYTNFETFTEKKKINEFIHPNDFKRVNKLLKDIFRTDYGIEEVQIKYKDKPFKWFEIKGNGFIDNEDNKKKAILIGREITKFKNLEFEIKKSQARFGELADYVPEIQFWKLLQTREGKSVVQKTREMLEIVLDNIPQLIYWKDKNLVYIGCNKNFALLNKISEPTSIIGSTDEDLIWLKEDVKSIKYKENQVMKNDSAEYNAIESLSITDDQQTWFEVNRIPLHNPKGEVVGILVTYEDITIRKIAEERLKESEEKYRGILDNIKETYFEVDLKGNFTFFNHALIELIGYSKNELLGANYRNFVDEENKNKIFKVYNEVYRTSMPKSDFQFQFPKKNGDLITCESSVYLIYDSEGNKIGFSGLARDITEKFLLEQKIKDSETKYRHLFENSPYSILVIDRKGFIIDCNPVTEKLFNRKIESLINKNFLDVSIKPEKTLPLFKQRYQSILSGIVPEPLEVQITRSKSAGLIWISIDDTLVEIGGETFFQVIIQDITEKKLAEQELKKSQEELQILNRELEQKVIERTKDLIESEQQYRTTIDSLNDPLHVIDKELRIMLLNKELKKWLYNLNIDSNILGRKHPEAFPFLPDKVYEEYREVFETGKSLITIETTLLPNFDVITETRKIPIFSEGKVSQIITIIRDISERKKMEDQLKESERNFRNMITNLDEGYYKTDIDGNILYHNPAFNNISGFAPDEKLIGKTIKNLWENLEDSENYIAELMKNGFIRNYIVRVKKFNRDKIIIQINAHLIRDENGNPIAIEGTFNDITEKFRLEQELKESEKKLRQQNIELRKLDEVKNDFITMATHELKTPLISISGYTDYILMKYRNQINAEITTDLLTVQRNVNRLEMLMDQLLDVLKIDENELKLQKESVNVSKIINDCLDELSYLINEKNLEIILNINHEIILNIDQARIFTVFTNLILNAIKFTPDYGWIKISSKKKDNHYTFEIKDNGIGLAQNEINRLFKKFERIKPPIINDHLHIKDSGTGLGLYITKGIISAHGGKIWASSEGINKGSSFSFTIPI
ncbi:MAG: PAS domain S-box protein [Candidatus Hodarchaeota archaeon]